MLYTQLHDSVHVLSGNTFWESIWEKVYADPQRIVRKHSIDTPFAHFAEDAFGVRAAMWRNQNRVDFRGTANLIREQVGGYFPYDQRIQMNVNAFMRHFESSMVRDQQPMFRSGEGITAAVYRVRPDGEVR